jgi:2-polyprenyl-3-methyl-5-hydroxy-6-metoxy-1,4-benzoquinol methylase
MSTERACPACGEGTFRDRDVLPGLTTHTCTDCGLILSTIDRADDPVPEFALVDEPAYLRSVGAVRRRQAGEILSLLRPLVPTGATLLDVGCSFGFFLLEARRVGFDVRGIEPDPQAVELARASLGEDVVHHGLFSAATAGPGSADVICALDVIEHIPPEEHEPFARLVAESLTLGGIWVIKVPTTEGLYYKLSDLLVRVWPAVGARFVQRLWQTRYEFPHLVYFTRLNLTRWLERRGFEVIGHRYLQEVPSGTALDRLTTDHDISRPLAYLLAPAVVAANVIEAIRRRSDSLVVLARLRDTGSGIRSR